MSPWTLTAIERAFRDAWGADTCMPEELKAWSSQNPARGQCGPTSLVLCELIGGDLMRADVHRDGVHIGGHYWNRLPSGIEIDLTRQQFGADEVVDAGWVVPPPADMRPGRCVEQWELLRQRVFTALGGVPIDATTPSSS
ncbi:hypothetical protein AB0K00_53115 [Dactylosporangium sp. NPDC049525]|uniref:YunG family protein n=1 Tax=Dactylosporangium sp. NPDC049525 TaxID=3154730 RepID=UPI00341D3E1B